VQKTDIQTPVETLLTPLIAFCVGKRRLLKQAYVLPEVQLTSL